MAKVALITDTHWGVRNDSPVFLEYFQKSANDFFFPYLKKHGITRCIHLGDLVDRRKYVNINTAARLRRDFLEPLNAMVKTDIILGNHDVYFKDTNNINSMKELVGQNYPNITVHEKPSEIKIGSTSFQMLPWICKENEQEIYDAILNSTSSICIGHLELNGFEMYKGMVSTHGLESSVFDRFSYVFTGHYHHKSSRNNVYYLGAFTEHVWSDFNDPRGFHIFDTETHELTFHENPFKMFHMILYDDVENKDILETVNNTDYGIYKDTYLKIVVVRKTNPYAFDLLLDKITKASPADVTVVEDSSLFTDSAEDELVDEAQDTPTILESYIDGLTLPVEPDTIKGYMRAVYLEAMSQEITND